MSATIYELEDSSQVRDQGGTLDLHEQTGQWAMREAGLHDRFMELAREEGMMFRVMDKYGKLHIDLDQSQREDCKPEIDRDHLRQMLIDSVAPGTIEWGKKVTEVVPLGGGRHEINFADGSMIAVDLVVGADGAWSKVRPLVTDVKPSYVGVTMVELRVSDVDEKQPEIAKLVGDGSLFCPSPTRALIAQRNTAGCVRTYAAIAVPENWVDASGIDWNDASAAKQQLLDEYADWYDSLKELIRKADDDKVIPRAVYSLPVGHRWKRVSGVTLLGDAAHLMSPFGGQGANLALADAADLALKLVKHRDNVEAALDEYEPSMFRRATWAARFTAFGQFMSFNRFAPYVHVVFFHVVITGFRVTSWLTSWWQWIRGRNGTEQQTVESKKEK
ncbi:hypothetical protein AAVH_06758 [Aphelenchoides avenae]|nr:hypothetical protein AAVH_06758 [Aphelenchus avenae]